MAKKILVLGNGPSINKIDFSRLDPNITILGTNRIWLRVIPDYFFFHDIEILKELSGKPELEELKGKHTFASDWLKINAKKKSENLPSWLKIYDRIDMRKYVDCVSTSMEILDRNIFPNDKLEFYIAGVSLKWKEPSHFWKTESGTFLNTRGKDWYEPRFKRTLDNFETLKSKGFKMVSCTPDSNLNKIMRYESIGNFYV